MSNILILSASTGGGHNAAAKSLKKIFEKKNYDVEIVDALKIIDKKFNFLINGTYMAMADNFPFTYDFLYKTTNTNKSSKLILKSLSAISRDKIKEIVFKNNPKLIIATHPFAIPFIAKIKSNNQVNTPFISVVTDLIAHKLYFCEYVDAYIVASEYTKRKMIEGNIDADKIYPYGIPVREQFFNGNKNLENDGYFNILLMGGSLGSKQIITVIEVLEKIIPDNNIKIRAICGKNQKLFKNISYKFENLIKKGNLEVLGFVENVDYLMDKSHIFISKPGGLSSTEAILKNLPMVIPFLLPGQERENMEVLTYNDMAIFVKDIEKLPKTILKLIDRPRLLEYMKSNMQETAEKYSLEKIGELGEHFIKGV